MLPAEPSANWALRNIMKNNYGTVGFQSVEVNNRGRAVRTLSTEAPEPGIDVILELDIELQKKRLNYWEKIEALLFSWTMKPVEY